MLGNKRLHGKNACLKLISITSSNIHLVHDYNFCFIIIIVTAGLHLIFIWILTLVPLLCITGELWLMSYSTDTHEMRWAKKESYFWNKFSLLHSPYQLLPPIRAASNDLYSHLNPMKTYGRVSVYVSIARSTWVKTENLLKFLLLNVSSFW